MKYISRERVFYHPYLEQLHRLNEYNHIQPRESMSVMDQEQAYFYLEPFQQVYQLETYPYGTLYSLPQARPYLALQPSFNVIKTAAMGDANKADSTP
ncbi:alpha-S1-casein-like [Echinops telfairi]|uniref:Alpha-S1-casein-like n=1 Tax=Echinops telfairi TaxID=9371 RepID=A0AC55CJH1_ECHTE|nr:alpha-S1-casein-like [Echinops telfairi]